MAQLLHDNSRPNLQGVHASGYKIELQVGVASQGEEFQIVHVHDWGRAKYTCRHCMLSRPAGIKAPQLIGPQSCHILFAAQLKIPYSPQERCLMLSELCKQLRD